MHKYNKITALSLAILIFIAVITFYFWANQNKTLITPEVKNTANNTVNNDSKPVILVDENFSVQIPADFTLSTKSKSQNSNSLNRYVLNHINRKFADQIAITSGTLTSEGILGLSDIKFRTSNTNYIQVNKLGVEGANMQFLASNPYEYSLFWEHANKYVAIVVSGNQERSVELQKIMQEIVKNWHWI